MHAPLPPLLSLSFFASMLATSMISRKAQATMIGIDDSPIIADLLALMVMF
jgi:hypothetical protein